jgi:acyl-CoA synthetase (AMP-forming)/AMP-acid ligase II
MKGMKNFMRMYDTPNDISIANFLERAKNQYPDKAAVTFKDTTYTWKRVYERTVMLACYLREQGVQSGDRVACCGLNSNTYFELFFACSFIGAVTVPINFRLSQKEIDEILEDCDPVLFLQDVTEEMYKSVWEFEPFTPAVNTDPYTICYTGGTTGKSKGVVLSHINQFVNCLSSVTLFNLDETEKTLVCGPFFHVAAQNRIFVNAYLSAHLVIMEKFDAKEFMENIQKYEINSFTLVPTMLQMLIDHPDFYNTNWSSVKRIQYVGSPIPKPLLAQLKHTFHWVDFYDSLGMTEATGTVLNNGKLPHQLDAKIVEGELWIKGPQVMEGYWKQPELTMNAFEDGWYKTGDAVYKDGDKYILNGRIKDMFISGAENVYPMEIERVLIDHPKVKEVAVVGVSDDFWGEVGHAFIVGEEDDYESYCREYLAGYKTPKYYTYLEELPLTSVGKVDKQALKLL